MINPTKSEPYRYCYWGDVAQNADGTISEEGTIFDGIKDLIVIEPATGKIYVQKGSQKPGGKIDDINIDPTIAYETTFDNIEYKMLLGKTSFYSMIDWDGDQKMDYCTYMPEEHLFLTKLSDANSKLPKIYEFENEGDSKELNVNDDAEWDIVFRRGTSLLTLIKHYHTQ